MRGLRTWIEIDRRALEHNFKAFLKLLTKQTRFMAVVKSNAYGHGLTLVAKQLANSKLETLNSKRVWFGVDSIVEALRLREEGIKNSILVLGSTLPGRMKEVVEKGIILTVSSFESFEALVKLKFRPEFHIKIDTGMHRQGFLPEQVPKFIKLLKRFSAKGGSVSGGKLAPQGVYTHFASKDWGYPAYMELQFEKFKKIVKQFQRAGFRKIISHSAASDGTLLFPQAHLDMVRVGMGLYGYWPSWVAKVRHPSKMTLKPVLSWKTVVVEIKKIPKGAYVGYDLIEQVSRVTEIAVLPVGYWHGYDRGFSSIGEVLIRGKRAKVLGRVSMDMTVVDITDIPKVKVGDRVVLIGRQGREEIWADEVALKIGTSQYEFLTRINPLIERIIVP